MRVNRKNLGFGLSDRAQFESTLCIVSYKAEAMSVDTTYDLNLRFGLSKILVEPPWIYFRRILSTVHTQNWIHFTFKTHAKY